MYSSSADCTFIITSSPSLASESFGYTSRITSLLTIPTGIISFLASFFFSWVAGYTTKYRSVVAAVSVVPPMIGVILLHTLPLTNTHGRLGAIYVRYSHFILCLDVTALMASGRFCTRTGHRTFSVKHLVSDSVLSYVQS